MYSIHAIDFPNGVVGVASYDFYTEYLPRGSKGIYEITASKERGNHIKYIGSAKDINSRLLSHHKSKLLVPGDRIKAIIFDSSIRQTEILNYEKALIERLSPPLNKHSGAPGRPWQCEQFSKLHVFLKHNEPLLTPQGKEQIKRILEGKENVKIRRSLLRIMRMFR
jgi:hypothetical protein